MNRAELTEKIATLPPDDLDRVARFIDGLNAEHARRREVVERLRGKYRDALPPVDEYLARKHAETATEETRKDRAAE